MAGKSIVMPNPGPSHALFQLNDPSRRRFLKKTSTGLVALSLARVALSNPFTCAQDPVPQGASHFLSSRQFRVLEAICDRIIPSSAEMPGSADLKVPALMDRFLSMMDKPVADQIAELLELFEISPLVFDFRLSCFTSLSSSQREEVLRSWANSRFEFRRTGFQALRRLSMAAYYGQEATWKTIEYDGPFV